MIGKTISHYKILEKLGGGGMGVVYKAQDTKLDRFVALKFLPPHISADEDEKKRFIQEAKAASALDHQNICTIHEIDETEDGQLFICMAYYEGETLKGKIDRGPLKIDEAVDTAIQIAKGLIKAHNSGITHRDIKPANVMVTNNREDKIVDFGLAKHTGKTSLTGDGIAIGTAAYMSPEQAKGEKIDHRTDIWSLGVVLYQMITGALPFQGEYEQAIIYSILNEEPRPTTELRAGVSAKLGRIVEKALAKDTAERYQHVDEMLVDLCSYQADPESESFEASFAKRKPALSIAVLPFADMSPEKDQEYFCDGMAEELINTLTRVEGLRVTSRTSAFQFKGQAQDIRDIAEQLNVATVLEGSVRKSGDKLRITAQLVKASEGFQLWSERFERDVKDIFAVQDEISEAIVNTLKSKLVDAARVTALRRYTENLEAYNLYLQGRYYWAKRTEEDLNKGIEFFNQAIDIDPDYALAYSGLADSHIMLGTYGALAPKKTMPKAEKAALNALRIDESLAEAHASLGCFRAIYNWDWSTAEQDFRRAIELNPSYATAHHWYSINCLAPQKRFDDAFAHMKRARDLDPLSHFINASMGLLHYFSGQYDLAIENYQKTIDMEPNFGVAHFFQGQAYLKQAKYREAITAFVEAIALHGDSTNMLANLTNAYAVMGKNDGARKRLSQLLDMAKDRYVSEYDVAIIHASFGEHDKAFEWLEMARSERSYLLIYLNVDPMMQNLRPDPRFAGQLEQIGLS